MVKNALFSSADKGGTDDWGTDQEFFDYVDEVMHFEIDVCATPDLAKCDRFFTPEQNGLVQRWAPYVCWMNPPYSENIRWVMYAEREGRRGAIVAALVPSRTDTDWWMSGAKFARYILFVEGRLTFYTGEWNNPAPFPSALLFFCGKQRLTSKQLFHLEKKGHLVDQSYRIDSHSGLYLPSDAHYGIFEDEEDDWDEEVDL